MLIIFIIVVAVQLAFYLFFFSRLADYELLSPSYNSLPSVSIVICAHDEINSIKKNLPSILGQKYPEYEVIVVNDNSQDDSEMVLMQMQLKYPHLRVRDIRNSSKVMRGKKYPLTIGIRAASYDYVLLTDADCSVSSDYWLRDMAALFNSKKEIILGYAPFKKYPGILNRFIRYEGFITALQYFSFALAKMPYMGVGRNLAYRKQLFFDYNIYPKYPQLLSGDDDLLINAAANNINTDIQIRNSTFMHSEPKRSWEEYWLQKQRHVSTSKYYRLPHKLLLFAFAFTNFLTYLILLVCLLYTSFQFEVLLLFISRLVAQGIVFKTTMKKLGEEDLFLIFPFMDILFLFYYVKLFSSSIKTKSNTWN